VMAQYQRQRSEQEAGERMERQQAERAERANYGRRQAEFSQRLKLLRARRRAFWMAVIAALLIAWGVWSLIRPQ